MQEHGFFFLFPQMEEPFRRTWFKPWHMWKRFIRPIIYLSLKVKGWRFHNQHLILNFLKGLAVEISQPALEIFQLLTVLRTGLRLPWYPN
ncbi:hypothetical protein AHAS_Ahas09G0130000 [Arachis hypogaea]